MMEMISTAMPAPIHVEMLDVEMVEFTRVEKNATTTALWVRAIRVMTNVVRSNVATAELKMVKSATMVRTIVRPVVVYRVAS